jgi:chitooligosaccharide deacetylase
MDRVALTFDDGPSAWTEPILDILAAHGAHATFFLIGRVAERHSDIVRRISAEGHEVGNHTWSHPHLARDCDDDSVRLELLRANDGLASIVGSPPRRFRAPYYDVDDRVVALAAELGLTHTPGTVIPPDWHPTARGSFIATVVLQRVTPAAIVGLHDGFPPEEADQEATVTRLPTVEAVAVFVPTLFDRGYECVTASMLLDATV